MVNFTLFKDLLEDEKKFFLNFQMTFKRFNELNKNFTIKLRNPQYSIRKWK